MSGAHTASGKAILANDPHLEYAIPSTWYQVQLTAPGLNVTGVSLPGVPCVIIGHNDRIAWGITNLHFDVQDLYRERFNPQNGQYLYAGKPEQARAEQDVILVKGEKPATFTTWVTRHGPIFLAENNQYYSLRWTAAEPGSFQFPFPRSESRAQLGGIQRCVEAYARARLQSRVCGRGWQHRLSRCRYAAHPPQLRRRCAARRINGSVRMGRLHPL